MKLLIVVTTHFELDGITNTVMNYYVNMDKTDMQVDFIVPNKLNERLKFQIEHNGGRVYELTMRKKNPILYWYNLWNRIQKEQYDIIHAHGNSATLITEMSAARVCGLKVRIAHCHNTDCNHRIINRLLKPLFFRMYTHGFACSTNAGKWLFGKNKFYVINNGTDIRKYSYDSDVREAYRNKYNMDGKKVIGHVGNFVYQKNHEFIIDTFYELNKMNPDCLLVLIGDGVRQAEMKQKVSELGINNKVVFLGKTLEVPQLLQAMDVMILPSRFEGLPNVAVEWQIAGLPSIISDVVTVEVKLTSLVEFLPLSNGPKAWAYRLNSIKTVDRQEICQEVTEQIKEAGFDIRNNAIVLKNLYINLFEEEK